jgi:AAA family ATP:ADP antiporter
VVVALSVALHLAMPMGGLVLPLAYVFTHGVKELVYLLFWIYAGNLFTSQQSQRLFPLFAGALLVGKIAGGFAATYLATRIHAENFLGAQAVGFAACVLVMLVFGRYLPHRAPNDQLPPIVKHTGVRASLRNSMAGFRVVSSDRLLQVFAFGIFLWFLIMQVGNYLYMTGLDASSTSGSAQANEDLFSQLYASVYTSSSIVALVMQTFLTGWLLRRFGVGVMLFMLPVWYLGSFGGALMSFTFVTAVAIQLGERVFVPFMHRPATEMIFDQVPVTVRPRARAFVSGAMNALGTIGAAVVLLLAGFLGVPMSGLLGAFVVISAVYVAATWSLQRNLGKRIAENLVSADPDLRHNALASLRGQRRAAAAKSIEALEARARSEGARHDEAVTRPALAG